MLKTAGSKAQTELIEFLQDECKKRNKNYIPKAYHKPNISYIRRILNFINPFYIPAQLKK